MGSRKKRVTIYSTGILKVIIQFLKYIFNAYDIKNYISVVIAELLLTALLKWKIIPSL